MSKIKSQLCLCNCTQCNGILWMPTRISLWENIRTPLIYTYNDSKIWIRLPSILKYCFNHYVMSSFDYASVDELI